jgi:NAD(P)-dependent dehydrogenase (short-subunit alcohol dehydrogenase family)
VPMLLITGANRGLGLEFVKQFAKDGWTIHACCRDPKKATELSALAKTGKVTVHALDVESGEQVAALAKALKDVPIDVLLNNSGTYPRGSRLGQLDYAAWEKTHRVNTLGPMRMAEAFVEQVARSAQKKIVNITSLMGSIGDNTSGGSYAYRASKAALNMATVSLALDLKERGITAIVIHPGWVKTDMGGPEAPTTPEQSIAGMRKVIAKVGPADTGKFYDFEGDVLPW